MRKKKLIEKKLKTLDDIIALARKRNIPVRTNSRDSIKFGNGEETFGVITNVMRKCFGNFIDAEKVDEKIYNGYSWCTLIDGKGTYYFHDWWFEPDILLTDKDFGI